ncbi:MAG: CBS domain-containing protein [Desulfatiglandaceae bacterium]
MPQGQRKKSRHGAKRQKKHDQVITSHINADFDALGSMIAAEKLYPGAIMVFPGSQEKHLRDFFLHSSSYLYDFVKLKDIDLGKVKRLVLVDTRQRSRIGKFATLLDRHGVDIHIYDHHAEFKDDIKGNLEVIRPTGSTTAILTEILRRKGIGVTADEATIMCLGIHEDTGSFAFSSTTPEDYEAAAWLARQGANHSTISDMLTRELTAEQIWLLNDLTQSALTRNINGVEIVFAKVIRENYVGDFAVLVHKFMEMENLNVVFALAQMEDRIYLVARSRIPEVNVSNIALALGGGGHPYAASATIKNKTLIQVERSLQALLRSRTEPAQRAKALMTSPAIHVLPGATVKEAAELMTRYNINVLLVMEENGKLKGYVTRQTVGKAIYFGLNDASVSDYMNIDFPTVHLEASLKEVQNLIIHNKLRILPVMEGEDVAGVITRTDLLNILIGGPLIPELFYESKDSHGLLRKKKISATLKERLPRNIIEILKNIGKVADSLGYNSFLVGGLVRDVLLKRDNLDVDIVIEGDGIKFAQAFSRQFGPRVRSHKKFGTAVMIFPDGFKVDIATARMEYYETPAAAPIVETSSLKLDLYRRDFTINTLAVKLNRRDYGTLLDFFGGQKDIKERVLRVLHNLSFVEDPTRILRAVRFEQRFGFKIGKLTLALIKNAIKINCFKDLSGHRLFTELKLVLKEDNPFKAIERMDQLALFEVIHPDIRLTDDVRHVFEEIRRVVSWYNLLYLEEPLESWKVYWHGLTSDLEFRALTQFAERLGMLDQENRRMIAQRKTAGEFLEKLYKFSGTHYELHILLTPYDTETLLFFMAKATSEKIKRFISLYFTRLRGTQTLLGGKDLLEMGFTPGPNFKKILEGLLERRLNEEVKTREDEVAFVREHFQDLKS